MVILNMSYPSFLRGNSSGFILYLPVLFSARRKPPLACLTRRGKIAATPFGNNVRTDWKIHMGYSALRKKPATEMQFAIDYFATSQTVRKLC